MQNSTYDVLCELLYNSSENEIISFIKRNTEPKMLHYLANNYNWNNGFDIPKAIIESKYCDLGTALMIFDDAEGYLIFFDEDWKKELDKNVTFVSYLKMKIQINDFEYNNIKYKPSLTRADAFRLKKRFTDINKVFIEGTDGEELNIPIV